MSDALEQVVPEGWAMVALGNGLAADVQPGFACGVNNRDEIGTPHLRPMNVSVEGQIVYDDVKYIPPDRVDSNRKLLLPGDVLFNNTNSDVLVGKTALYDDDAEVAFSNHMTRVRCSGAVLPKYCALALHQRWREGYFLHHCNRHVSQASISQTVLKSTYINLPPLVEQERIVAKVEALLSQVQAVRHRIAAVPSILNKFRQAVLAQACSGRLTEEWREKEVDVDARDERIASLLRERRRMWEQKNPGRRSYKEPCEATRRVIPEVPSTWAQLSVDAVLRDPSALAYGILKPGPETPGGVPMVRIKDIDKWGRIAGEPMVVSPDVAKRFERTRLESGDILLAVMGTVGRTAIVPPALRNGNVNRALAVLKLTKYLQSEFAHWVLSSPLYQEAFQADKIGSAQLRINLSSLRQFEFPVPPIEEQEKIVRIISALFVEVDSIETHLIAASKRIEALIHSILFMAFSGDLVPTEAELARVEGRDYESADQLLLRIRKQLSQRAAEKTPTRKRAIQDISGMKDKVIIKVKRKLLVVLKEANASLSPEDLFRQAGCTEDDVDGFYQQLRKGIETGQIVQTPEKPDPNNPTVVLIASRV